MTPLCVCVCVRVCEAHYHTGDSATCRQLVMLPDVCVKRKIRCDWKEKTGPIFAAKHDKSHVAFSYRDVSVFIEFGV